MATYLPNVKQYVSKSKAFTPNFKFLSDALARRQDRYDTNYRKMNNLYGSVVNADLSREDNRSLRDKYAEELAPKLQQISGVDFSLQQNVDAARGLFTPFFEDEKIVRDIVFTKRYQNELQKLNMMRSHRDEEMRKKYSEEAVAMINFQMDDFKNFSREESMNVQLPEAVEKVNLIEIGVNKLKELGMEYENVTFTEDGHYRIIQKNGTALTKRAIGKDENGNMQYTNPAQNYILQTTLDDPAVRRWYHTKFYVKSRQFAEQNKDKYGSMDAAYKVFYDQTKKDYSTKAANEELAKDTELNNAIQNKNNWEEYKKKFGQLIPGSQEFIDYANAYNEYIALANGRKLEKKKHELITSDAKELSQLKNQAWEAYMQYNIDADTKAAAAFYADINAKTEVKADEFALKNHQHKLNMIAKEQDAYNTRMKVMLEKGYTLDDSGNLIPLPWAEGGSQSSNVEGQDVGVDFGQGAGNNVVAGSGEETMANYPDGDGVVDVIDENAQTTNNKIQAIRDKRWSIIEAYHQVKATEISDSENPYSSEGMYIDGKLMTWKDAKDYYMKEGNRHKMTAMFDNIVEKAGLNTDGGIGPKMQRDNPILYKAITEADRWVNAESTRILVGMDKQRKVYRNVIDQLVAEGSINSFQGNMLEAYPLFNKTGEIKDPNEIRGQMETDFMTWYTESVNNNEIEHVRPSKVDGATAKKHRRIAAQFGFKSLDDLYDFIYPWNHTYGENYSLKLPGRGTSNHMEIDQRRIGRHFDNVYNEVFGKDKVQDLYNDVKDKINLKMQSAESIPGIQNFNMASWLSGQEQSGSGATMFNYYDSDYINGQVNTKANTQLRLINQLISGPKQNYTVALGNRSAEYVGETDQGALNLLNEIIRDLGMNPDDFSKGKGPNMTIRWSERLGGDAGQGNYSGWVITLGEEYASTKKSTNVKLNNNIVDFNLPDNSITIFAPKDMPNPNSVANTYVSTTEFLVDANKARIISNDGGKVKFYKNSSGQMVVQHSVGTYDKVSGNIVYTEYSAPKILPPSGYKIDELYDNMAMTLENQVLVNNAAREAHKKELEQK